MSLVLRFSLTILLLCGLLIGTLERPVLAAETLVTAFNMESVQPDLRLVQNFNRDRRDRRRIRRPRNDWIPLRPPPNSGRQRGNGVRQQPPRRNRVQDQDAARDAVRRGEVLALDGIIRSVKDYCPGTFLDASLERKRGGIFYRVKILRPSGQRVVLGVDARTGAVVAGRCR